MQAWAQFDVHQIFVAGQNVAGVAVLHKIDARDIISFEENILILLLDQWLQQRTNPRNERHRPI